jgi:hypothetical protein
MRRTVLFLLLPLLLLSLYFDAAAAVRFRVRGAYYSKPQSSGYNGASSLGLLRASSPSSSTLLSGAQLVDKGDFAYYTNLTLNQKVFSVLVDTGTSVIITSCVPLLIHKYFCYVIRKVILLALVVRDRVHLLTDACLFFSARRRLVRTSG